MRKYQSGSQCLKFNEKCLTVLPIVKIFEFSQQILNFDFYKIFLARTFQNEKKDANIFFAVKLDIFSEFQTFCLH